MEEDNADFFLENHEIFLYWLERKYSKGDIFVHVDHVIDPPPPLWTDMDNLETPPPPLPVHMVYECRHRPLE